MKISKALITLADPKQQSLPLQTLFDQQGRKRSALEIVLEETISSGVDEVGLIVCPGTQSSYLEAAGDLASRVHFIVQTEPTGYADAILLSEDFTEGQPFLHLVGDHLCVSEASISCAKQVLQTAIEQDAPVSGVQATHESQIASFGAIGGQLNDRSSSLYDVKRVLEKPSPTEAELELVVPGLRAGFYLCFFGIHALKPSIFDYLRDVTSNPENTSKSLSSALDLMAKQERLLALEVSGARFDIGADYGLLFAQLALSFSGKHRDRILTGVLEMLANKSR